ncbi:MAG: TIGR02186 family protein [Pseudomonadota bacterium]
MGRVTTVIGLLLLGGAAVSRGASAQEVVADLSHHLIAITTEFTGTAVTLFGSIEGEGDIAVIVRGPSEPVTVRQKDRVAGVWINSASLTFEQVPSYYSVAANRPLDNVARPSVLTRHGIGLNYLNFPVRGNIPRIASPDGGSLSEEATIDMFREALIRNFQHDDLYVDDLGVVTFLGPNLFRATIEFPTNVPTGQYTVSVYLIRDGDIVTAQTSPLVVSKIGLGANIFDFSRRNAAAYGLLAIAMAVFFGWLASIVFRSPR